MTHIFQQFKTDIIAALVSLQQKDILPNSLDLTKITAEPPRENQHGDIATNAAMSLAKSAGMVPKQLAEHLALELQQHSAVETIEIAGPGFINFTLKSNFWRQTLQNILKAGQHYGTLQLGDHQTINLEFLSANPTGPIHIGHCRGAIVGDVLANILIKAGFNVIKEYYINDAGAQVNHLARSVYHRYLQALDLPSESTSYYGGDYLIPVGQALADQYGKRWAGQPESEWLTLFRHFTVDKMMVQIKHDLGALNIYYDVYTSEQALVDAGKVEEAYELLKTKGVIYRGKLEAPKGKTVEDYDPREQDLFRSTDYGDDTDRPLKKSDGTWTYFAPDIAYHLDKFQRGADKMILILGADHAGYVPRLSAAVKALSDNKAQVIARLCQIVKFIDNGQILKMSKRAGVFVPIDQAIAKVGRDAMRFMMVWRKNDAPLDFDFAKVIDQSRDNPVFYVQYAYARCHSVKRHAVTVFQDKIIDTDLLLQADLSLIADDGDLQLIKLLASWPRIIEAAAEHYEPHRISYYLYDVASSLHALWNRGKDNTQLRFITPDNFKLTLARLALLQAVINVLDSGLHILGIEAKQEMGDANK